MRISVVLPDSLSSKLELCWRQERRRAASDALMRAAQEAPMDKDQVRHALHALKEERERSDRI